MKIEKNFIALSAIAIMLGIASIVPLVFFLSAKNGTTNAWFSVDMPYVYLETRAGAINQSNPLGDTINVTNHPVFSHRFGYVFNITMNADLKTESDETRIEYYEINITSDGETLESNIFSVGTSSNITAQPPNDWRAMQNNLSSNRMFDGGGGLFIAGWSEGFSRLWDDGTGGSGTGNKLFITLREAQTVNITLYRLGWASWRGNLTIATFTNDEVVCKIQLKRFTYNSWLYNNDFLPMRRLLEIDPAKPVILDPKTDEYVPNM